MIIYTCSDNFEDMMTCIYDAWASKEGHKNIRLMTEPVYEPELFCEYRHVDGDSEKSKKVIRSVQKQISFQAYQMIFQWKQIRMEIMQRIRLTVFLEAIT